MRYIADRLSQSCGCAVLVPEVPIHLKGRLLFASSAAAAAATAAAAGEAAGAGAAAAAAGAAGLSAEEAIILRCVLFLLLHEGVDAVGFVGIDEGAADALLAAANLLGPSGGVLALPAAALQQQQQQQHQQHQHQQQQQQQQQGDGGFMNSSGVRTPQPPHTLMKLFSLPSVDAVAALFPSSFSLHAVADKLRSPSFVLFDKQNNKKQTNHKQTQKQTHKQNTLGGPPNSIRGPPKEEGPPSGGPLMEEGPPRGGPPKEGGAPVGGPPECLMDDIGSAFELMLRQKELIFDYFVETAERPANCRLGFPAELVSLGFRV